MGHDSGNGSTGQLDPCFKCSAGLATRDRQVVMLLLGNVAGGQKGISIEGGAGSDGGTERRPQASGSLQIVELVRTRPTCAVDAYLLKPHQIRPYFPNDLGDALGILLTVPPDATMDVV